jgi:hypothetical protein
MECGFVIKYMTAESEKSFAAAPCVSNAEGLGVNREIAVITVLAVERTHQQYWPFSSVQNDQGREAFHSYERTVGTQRKGERERKRERRREIGKEKG